MYKISKEKSDRIIELLNAASRITGLRLCLHDRQNFIQLPEELKTHVSSFCRKMKKIDGETCLEHDFHDIHNVLKMNPEGQIHVCPYNATEIAVPIFLDSILVGVLFGGQIWCREEDKPDESLIVPPSEKWLADQLLVLQAVALKIAKLMTRHDNETISRRDRIITYINSNLSQPLTVSDIAAVLNLSNSRTGHVIKELFQMTCPELIMSTKIQEAVRLLIMTDRSIISIALSLGFNDQNYFTKVFKKKIGTPPLKYRQQHAAKA